MSTEWRGCVLRCALAAAAGVFGLWPAGAVRAQAQATDQVVEQCTNSNPASMVPWDVAITACTKAIESHGWAGKNMAWAYIDRCQALDHSGKYELAIADCNRGIRLDPADPNGFLNRGIAYKNRNDFTRAIADYDHVLQLKPNYAKAYGDRGNVYFAQKNYTRAIADYDEAIRLDPQFANAYYGRGLAKQLTGDAAGGDADIAKAREIDPNIGK